MSLRVVLLGLIVILIGVGVVLGIRQYGGNSTPSAQIVENNDTEVAKGDPFDFADRFALIWMSGDYSALFDMVHEDSQRLTPYTVFADFYNNFEAATSLTKITVAVVNVTAESALFHVDLRTRYYGTFEYTVVLKLAELNGNFYAIWHPSAIHPDLPLGGAFKSFIKRPRRGNIYDKDGLILATTGAIRYVGLDRINIQGRGNREGIEEVLLDIGFEKDVIAEAFDSELDLQQRVKVGEVTEEILAAVIEAQRSYPGLIMWIEEFRLHPLGSAAAHIVGYTGEYTANELANLQAL